MNFIELFVLLCIIFLGYAIEDRKGYYLFLLLILVPSGALMGYFLEENLIYGILFILGLAFERIYFTYKWPVTKRPKTASYKPINDWSIKLIATLIIILCIDLTSKTNLVFNFISFFAGVIASWIIKKFEKR